MGRLLSDLASGLQLGEFSRNRQALAAVALSRLYKLEFKPQGGQKCALLTHLGFEVSDPFLAGRPAARVGTLSAATATIYATVATWTVTAGRSGRLREVSGVSNIPSKTNWQLTIGGVQQFTGFSPAGSLAIPFPPENQLPPGAVVLLEAASTDGTAVTANGLIGGSEFFDHLFTCNLQKGGFLVQRDLVITRQVIHRGLDLWAEITDQSPLTLELTNVNGYGGEVFSACAELFNMNDTRLSRARHMLLKMSMIDDRYALPANGRAVLAQ